MYSCANIGNPSGGPIDKTPPIFMRSNPTPNAVNVKDRKIEIFFDEIVTLKDPSTKIIVSPAQTEMPRMSALGRKVTVELVDSLLPNTTYTIDFSNSTTTRATLSTTSHSPSLLEASSTRCACRATCSTPALWSQCRASWWGCKAILPTPPFTRRNCNAWR